VKDYPRRFARRPPTTRRFTSSSALTRRTTDPFYTGFYATPFPRPCADLVEFDGEGGVEGAGPPYCATFYAVPFCMAFYAAARARGPGRTRQGEVLERGRSALLPDVLRGPFLHGVLRGRSGVCGPGRTRRGGRRGGGRSAAPPPPRRPPAAAARAGAPPGTPCRAGPEPGVNQVQPRCKPAVNQV
jgi:hypothetical protein